MLSQEHVFVVQRAIRAPQGAYRAGHAGQRQFAGSTSLSELEELVLEKGYAGVGGVVFAWPAPIILLRSQRRAVDHGDETQAAADVASAS